jgi:hypothetical protein
MMSNSNKRDVIVVRIWGRNMTRFGLLCDMLPSNFVKALRYGLSDEGDIILLIMHKIKRMIRNGGDIRINLCRGVHKKCMYVNATGECKTHTEGKIRCICNTDHCCHRCKYCHGECTHYQLEDYILRLLDVIRAAIIPIDDAIYSAMLAGIYPKYNLIRHSLIDDQQLEEELPNDGDYASLYTDLGYLLRECFDDCMFILDDHIIKFLSIDGRPPGHYKGMQPHPLDSWAQPTSDWKVLRLDWLV